MNLSSSQFSSQPTPMQAWIMASRPKTLPAAAAPVIVGSAAAFAAGHFQWIPALAALAGALLLQIGANLANDLFDYKKGVDTAARLGPTRVTQAGLLTPRQVQTGMMVAFGAAALVGVYLILVGGWPILAIGVASILAAIAYTGGPFPYGYHGLGELFVFLFFGLAAVCGTYYVQVGQFSWLALACALPMGWLSTAILIVNNLRDLENDRVSGRKTLAVRFGAAWTRKEYAAMLVCAYLVPPVLWLTGLASPWVMLAWLSLFKVPGLVRAVFHEEGRPLNRILAGTGQLELLFGLFFSLGLALSVLVPSY